jgi:hypothetical protein
MFNNSTELNLSFNFFNTFESITLGPIRNGKYQTSPFTLMQMKDAIPNNCTYLGNSSILLSVNYTDIMITYPSNLDIDMNIPCQETALPCGKVVKPRFDTSCCYMNGQKVEGITFQPNSSYTINSLQECVTDSSPIWFIAAIVLAVVAGIMLFALLFCVLKCCTSSAAYL